MAQWTFNDGCWEHRACDMVLLHRRYSEGKLRKLIKTKKEEKQETEDGKTLIWFHSSIFQTLAYTVTAIYTADCIYKLRHRIIQSFGSEETPGGFFIYSSAAFHTSISSPHQKWFPHTDEEQ